MKVPAKYKSRALHCENKPPKRYNHPRSISHLFAKSNNPDPPSPVISLCCGHVTDPTNRFLLLVQLDRICPGTCSFGDLTLRVDMTESEFCFIGT